MRYIQQTLREGNPAVCWEWPYTKANGYARMRYGDGVYPVHRIVKELVGDPIPDHLIARHLCGNGHLGCWNPSHVVAGTAKENEADKAIHGTDNTGERNGRSKLTNEAVAAIRAKYARGGVNYSHLAEEFGVNSFTIGRVVRRQQWAHVPDMETA
jgi:hypothetical protein